MFKNSNEGLFRGGQMSGFTVDVEMGNILVEVGEAFQVPFELLQHTELVGTLDRKVVGLT